MEAAAEVAEVVEAVETAEPTRVEQAAEVLEVVATEGDAEVGDEADPLDAVQEKLEEYVAAEMEGDEGGDDEPAPRENVGKEYRALRKRKRQIEKREQEFTEKMDQFVSQQEQLEKGLELVRLMQENPEMAFGKFAELAGTDADDFYEQLTTQRLNGGEAPEESPAMREVKRLRAELKEEREAEGIRREEYQQERHQQEYQRTVEWYVREVAAIPGNDQLSERWPHLAVMRPDILESRARYAVAWAIENSPKSTLPEVVDALDGIVGEEYSYTLDRMNRGSGNPSAEVKPEGLGKPVQSKPKSLTLTNSDAAVTSRHLREMSQSDRVKAAASALPDLVALMKN